MVTISVLQCSYFLALRAESIPTIGVYLYRCHLFCNTMKEKIYMYLLFSFLLFLVFCCTLSKWRNLLIVRILFFLFSAMPPNNNQLIVSEILS